MVAEAKSIAVPIDSDTARLLREADEAPVVFIVGDERYRVLREKAASPNEAAPAQPASDDPWAAYDPEKAVAGMLAAAGSWSDVDADRLKSDIRRWRRVGSRPPTRS